MQSISLDVTAVTQEGLIVRIEALWCVAGGDRGWTHAIVRYRVKGLDMTGSTRILKETNSPS